MYTLDHGGVPQSANHKKREGKASMKLFLNGGGDGPQAALAYQRFSEIIDHAKPCYIFRLLWSRSDTLAALHGLQRNSKS